MASSVSENPLGYLGAPDATTVINGTVRLATTAETTAGTRTDLATTPAGVAAVAIAGAPNASTTTKGIVELATDAEAAAKSDTTRAITPSNLPSVMAAPGAIGGTTPAAGTFTTLTTSSTVAMNGGTFTVGSDNAANNIVLGSGTTARTITIGGSTGAHIVNIGNASAGAITVDTAAGISLDAATASNFTVTGAADLTLNSTAGSVNITGGENAADAIVLTASAGGIDILATGSAGEDIDIVNTGGSVNITATEDVANAVYIRANGGTSETIKIHADQGTGVASIDILSDAGGITLTSTGLASADAINLVATAGGIDVDAALQINIATSQNAADAMVLNASAGGIDITAAGAAGEDIDITCTSGSINVTAGESAADAFVLDASGAAGGVQIQAGTGGVLIGNQADCTTIDVGDFAPTASRTITVGGGTVVTASVTDTIDIGPDGATTNADSVKTVNINTGGVTTGQVLTNIASGAITSGTHTVSIQTGNAAAGTVACNISTGTGTKTVSLGNADAGTTFNIDAITAINNNVNAAVTINDGTSTGAVTIGNGAAGNIAVASGGTVLIDAAGVLELNSSAGVIGIGNDAVAQNINIGTGAAARTVTIGNTTGASALVLQSGTGEITVTGTVKEIDAEFLYSSGTDLVVTQSPIMQSNATTGAAPTGSNGDVNLMYMQDGCLMEQFIIGTQTIIAPRMSSTGLNIALDNTAAEGSEYNFGARNNAKHAYTIGTSAAFFITAKIYVEDLSGCAPLMVGFRKVEANNATLANYTDYACIGLNSATSATNVVILSELNSGGQTATDTTDAWGGDGSAQTITVKVSAAGVTTFEVNGSAASAAPSYTFDNTDVVMPFIHFLQGADITTNVDIQELKIGFQA